MTGWELFQSLTSEHLSPDIQIHFSNVADRATRNFAASITSAYKLSTRKTSILDQKYEIHGLDQLLKHEPAQKIMAGNNRIQHAKRQ
jgi:hypothetical protein